MGVIQTDKTEYFIHDKALLRSVARKPSKKLNENKVPKGTQKFSKIKIAVPTEITAFTAINRNGEGGI